MSYRVAFQPWSRVPSGEKSNTYLNMQWYKTAITKFGNKNCIDKHICFVHASFFHDVKQLMTCS